MKVSTPFPGPVRDSDLQSGEQGRKMIVSESSNAFDSCLANFGEGKSMVEANAGLSPHTVGHGQWPDQLPGWLAYSSVYPKAEMIGNPKSNRLSVRRPMPPPAVDANSEIAHLSQVCSEQM
eukprot:SAG31_NODE_10305_length_1157_cov_1.207940_2_plen_121_part_00